MTPDERNQPTLLAERMANLWTRLQNCRESTGEVMTTGGNKSLTPDHDDGTVQS